MRGSPCRPARPGQTGPSAADVVNLLPEKDLARLIRAFGEEKQARRIARAIVERRASYAFKQTLDLAEVIEEAVGGRRGRKTHPATQTFQAIRIYVNEELDELARSLSAAERMLAPGGRLVIVTFHSLEDRLVKTFLRERSGTGGQGSRYRPSIDTGPRATFELSHRKAVEPSPVERLENPRARSARLRAAVRTDAPSWNQEVETGYRVPKLQVLEVSP
ncbi:MAG: 16S rRNA (cytosine(1402)-N(4))-methyltransferase RsmH [Acidobacteriota bacterium]